MRLNLKVNYIYYSIKSFDISALNDKRYIMDFI